MKLLYALPRISSTTAFYHTLCLVTYSILEHAVTSHLIPSKTPEVTSAYAQCMDCIPWSVLVIWCYLLFAFFKCLGPWSFNEWKTRAGDQHRTRTRCVAEGRWDEYGSWNREEPELPQVVIKHMCTVKISDDYQISGQGPWLKLAALPLKIVKQWGSRNRVYRCNVYSDIVWYSGW